MLGAEQSFWHDTQTYTGTQNMRPNTTGVPRRRKRRQREVGIAPFDSSDPLVRAPQKADSEGRDKGEGEFPVCAHGSRGDRIARARLVLRFCPPCGERNQTTAKMMQLLQTQPTRIDHKGLHFLIMDAPSESNLPLYLEVCVCVCLRVCVCVFACMRRGLHRLGVFFEFCV